MGLSRVLVAEADDLGVLLSKERERTGKRGASGDVGLRHP
jgi:hypothetical protein